jgi:hypothetical protein
MTAKNAHSQEATYYRTALLLGLVREERVHLWAEQVIEQEPEPPSPFFEIVSVPVGDLSALRHALWPLVIEPEPTAVLEAIFGLLHMDLTTGHRQFGDTLTIVRQMRSMVKLPPAVYATLNAALVAQAQNPQSAALVKWLQGFAGSSVSKLRPE